MSSNSSDAQGGGGGGGGGNNDDQVELVLAIVAFVVSLFALLIAVMQALQQYFASATGYSSCSEQVIGQWAQFTKRRMRWDQFRFEVEFVAPVIFVAPPTNRKGPLGSHDEKPIVYMDGTTKSYKDTHTWSQAEFDDVQKGFRGKDTRQNIHTADNELATWLALLMAIQRMEKESHEWQENVFFGYKSPSPNTTPNTTLHTMTVAMQEKKRSWDTMPDGLKKPYATTTISHIVEITAMLGIHWRDFNRNDNTYRAQGNGFSLVGVDVDDLGIGFTFQKTGPTWFQDNRVVPNDAVKELCFGFCPTIFRAAGDKSYRYADEPRDKGTLQLGSFGEIGETLVAIGCNTNTVKYFRVDGEHARHTHIFPVPFEMLGMVGVVFQIENTAFRMLPNPTVYTWDKSAFSLRTLMIDYSAALTGHERSPRAQSIYDTAIQIENQFQPSQQEFVVDTDEGKNTVTATATTAKGDGAFTPEILSSLHAAIKDCDAFLEEPAIKPLVQYVLRVHLQIVLALLNEEDGDGDGNTATATAAAAKDGQGAVLLDQLDAASGDARHEMFIKLYTEWVCPNVVRVAYTQLQGEGKQARARRGTVVSTAPPEAGETEQKQRISDIWYTLVFRMLCWLMLHDFHKKDVQISKSDLYGSRLPVYIL